MMLECAWTEGSVVWRLAVVAAAVGVVAGCASVGQPYVVELPQADVRPVVHVSAVMSDEVALATMVAVVERELGVSVLPVTYHFYPREEAFFAAVMKSGHDASYARRAAGRLPAIAGYGHVLVNEGRLSLEWPDRLSTFSHEFTHCLQYKLARGRRSTSDQWLREGFADLVAARVLDRLGARPIETTRRQKLEQLQASDRSRAPRLETLLTFADWVTVTTQPGVAPYAQAFLAVDALVERHGVPAMLQYFAAFATSEDRAANFHAAFGQDLKTFESGVDAALGMPPRRERR